MSDGFNILDYPLAFTQPRWFTAETAWGGHIPFAAALIDMARPKTIVELGTHTGTSYCSFCHTVSALRLDTKCYAVDTWTGDEHAGSYGERVLSDLRAYHDPLYKRFSTLLRTTFDSAREKFEPGAVDILHIDGLHTYEAVKHDYETWQSRMSPDGVVLFHDTRVYERDFGVHKFWSEVSRGRVAFEFEHSHGLGVLCEGREAPARLAGFFTAAQGKPAETRALFAALGAVIERKVEAERARVARACYRPPGLMRRIARAIRADAVCAAVSG